MKNFKPAPAQNDAITIVGKMLFENCPVSRALVNKCSNCPYLLFCGVGASTGNLNEDGLSERFILGLDTDNEIRLKWVDLEDE